jgi:hypothetical protein
MTNQQRAVIEVVAAVLDTIKEMGPQGAPEGPLYAALMGSGCTLNQFQGIVGILVRSGKVRQSGHVLYAV